MNLLEAAASTHHLIHLMASFSPLFSGLTCKGEDKVIQPGREVIAAEGDSLTLNCTFETIDKSAYLFWYKQEVNSYPKYILKRDTYGTNENAPEFKKDRFDAELKDKSVHLQISSAAVTYSAVYYCVLRPTVTGNSKTLYKNPQSTQYSTLSTRGTPKTCCFTSFCFYLTF
uniref:Ig-like domain-containing protein n=1 Tax=Oryzias latipes TaxID=8090 RepID=A0A3B3ID87_ORYLA